MKSAKYWIDKLELQRHPEGGWYKEVFRSSDLIPQNVLPDVYGGERNYTTSIYYLLEGSDFSAFHRIRSDEIWHYYTGNSSIEIVSIINKEIVSKIVGNNSNKEDESFQVVVLKNTWFAARLTKNTGYALVGCTVSPGFHFDDFELADQKLALRYPKIKDEILKFIK